MLHAISFLSELYEVGQLITLLSIYFASYVVVQQTQKADNALRWVIKPTQSSEARSAFCPMVAAKTSPIASMSLAHLEVGPNLMS